MNARAVMAEAVSNSFEDRSIEGIRFIFIYSSFCLSRFVYSFRVFLVTPVIRLRQRLSLGHFLVEILLLLLSK
jgi:hypothetical protein